MQSALQMSAFQLTAKRIAKGRQSHAKRRSFANRKTAFCNGADYQAVSDGLLSGLQEMWISVSVCVKKLP